MIIKFTKFNFSHPKTSAKIISKQDESSNHQTHVNCAYLLNVGLKIIGKFSRGLIGEPLAILIVLPVIGLSVLNFSSELVDVSFVYVDSYVVFSFVVFEIPYILNINPYQS